MKCKAPVLDDSSRNFGRSSKMTLKNSGSLINWLMGNNQTIPELGKGATQLHYSDRTCYEVVKVSDDKREVRVEVLSATADKTKRLGMGHQEWILTPTGQYRTIIWWRNSWRIVGSEVKFSKEFIAGRGKNSYSYVMILTDEEKKAVYDDQYFPQNAVEGITVRVKTRKKINIIWGCKDYHYDWTF